MSFLQNEILSPERCVVQSGVSLKKRHLDWGLGGARVINNKKGPVGSADREPWIKLDLLLNT